MDLLNPTMLQTLLQNFRAHTTTKTNLLKRFSDLLVVWPPTLAQDGQYF